MAGAERLDAFALMKRFRTDEAALGDALSLYVERPDYGFVWLAYDDGIPAGCACAAFAVSTEAGGLVAELRDLWVEPSRRRRGIGSALLLSLQARLAQLGVRRYEVTVGDDAGLRAFLLARDYRASAATRFIRASER